MAKKTLSKEDLQARIESYKKHYPGKDLFFTEDGNCFLKKQQAEAHAKVEKIEVIEFTAEKPRSKEETGEMTEDVAKDTLATLELNEKTDYKLLGDIVEALGVETKGKKRGDYIEALAPIKEQLNEE